MVSSIDSEKFSRKNQHLCGESVKKYDVEKHLAWHEPPIGTDLTDRLSEDDARSQPEQHQQLQCWYK